MRADHARCSLRGVLAADFPPPVDLRDRSAESARADPSKVRSADRRLHPPVLRRDRHVPLPLVLLLAGFLGGFEVFLAAIPTYVGARWGLGYLARRRARPVGSQP